MCIRDSTRTEKINKALALYAQLSDYQKTIPSVARAYSVLQKYKKMCIRDRFLGGKRTYYPRDIEYFISGNERLTEGDGGDEEEFCMLALRLREGLTPVSYTHLDVYKRQACRS